MHSLLALTAMLAGLASASDPVAAAPRVRVIVALRDPDASAFDASDIERRHRAEALQETQQRVLRRAAAGASVYARWSVVPGFAAEVTKDELERLRNDPEVIAVDEDVEVRPLLTQSVPLIRADTTRNSGFTGAGVAVAVVDTGVDRTHPDLEAAVVAEACFCATSQGGGCCPNGLSSQTGAGAARDDDGHGTHVAGIIASRGIAAPAGVAPGSSIIAVRVLGNGSTISSTISGLDWILDKHPEVRVVNLSLGTTALFTGNCDNATATTINYASAINRLRANWTLVVAASGNDGSATQMVAPACVQNALSVGAVYSANFGSVGAICNDATTAADKIACFSDVSSTLDLLAPGSKITSTRSGGGETSKSGTSQAAPHVAGAAAVLFAARPQLLPSDVESILKLSGVSIYDSRIGLSFPRIDVEAAVLRALYGAVPTLTTPTASSVLALTATLGGTVASAGSGSITERGVVFAPMALSAAPRIGARGVTKVVASGTTGAFTTNVTGLSESTLYAFRAFATNGIGTAYSTVGSFTTIGLPIMGAPAATAITSASASLGAIAGTDGGVPITERGFVIAPTATNPSPTVGGAGVTKIAVAGTLGLFTAFADNLAARTSYSFRGYAGTVAGIGYTSTASFTTLGGLASARTDHTATLLLDGKVLVAGGFSSQSGGALASCELFDSGTTSFISTSNLATPRYAHSATLLLDGKVLIAGGRGSAELASAEIYDPVTGTFTATGSLRQGRYGHTATLLPDGRVLIAGGVGIVDVTLARAEIFDPSTGTFGPTGTLDTGRSSLTAALLSPGKVLLAGGYSSQVRGSVSVAELFDATTGTFTLTGSLLTPRYSAASVLLPTGAVIVTGGLSTEFGVLASAEIYYPTLPIFGTLASMGSRRLLHTATLLPSGNVLVVGGSNPSRGGAIADAELYSPETGTFTAARALAFARERHSATVLADGRVLIAGGTGANGASLSTVELYEGGGTAVGAPAVLSATAAGATRVDLAWTVVPGAVRYELYRSATLDGPWSQIAVTPQAFFTTSTGMTAGATYLFKVRAVGVGGTSAFSPVDAATLVPFTDPVLNRTVTVKGVHLVELRAAVNAMRAAAALAPATFTDEAVVARSTLIRRVHVVELRAALDEARAAIGLSPLTYTDATLPPGGAVKGVHLMQLRAGTQ